MKKRILIIEDQEQTASIIKEFLVESGFWVQVAANGRQAIKKFHATGFDILLTDYNLPDMDGKKVVAACKKMSPTVKIIFITGYHIDLKGLKKKIGPDFHVIEKPCKTNEILATINKTI